MDLSNTLGRVAKHFLKVDANLGLSLKRVPGAPRSWQVVIVADWKEGDKAGLARGTGRSGMLSEAFFRALCEVGEEIILVRDNFESRCGIAGGLNSGAALDRARWELLERDAFLYHYRSGIPFLGQKAVPSFPELVTYEMSSLDPSIKAVMVTSLETSLGKSVCIKFGTAAHTNFKAAQQKALSEYLVIESKHIDGSIACAQWSEDFLPVNLMDWHHYRSRDQRVVSLFSSLCKTAFLHKRFDSDVATCWREASLRSPLKHFKFFRAENSRLLNLEFGTVEPGIELYHPYW